MYATYLVFAVAGKEFFLSLLEIRSADFAGDGLAELRSALVVAVAVVGGLVSRVMLLVVTARPGLVFDVLALGLWLLRVLLLHVRSLDTQLSAVF